MNNATTYSVFQACNAGDWPDDETIEVEVDDEGETAILRESLRDEGRSFGYGESYAERNQ